MNKKDEKFLKKLKNDCPAELVELFDASKSDWRKAIIKQFIELHEWRQDITRKLIKINRYEKLILGVLSIIGTAYVSQIIIPHLLEFLAGL